LTELHFYGNTITEVIGNVTASVISRNIQLELLEINLLKAPLKLTDALQNLSSLQRLVFCTCNISEEVEINLASTISQNKSLKTLSLANINLSQNIILQSIATISNLTTLWLEDNLLSEEMSVDLSLAISTNKSLKQLILLDNVLQTGLINVAKACNKLSNIQVLQLAHNCIVPNKIVELISIITKITSLERFGILLGGITLNATQCFHFNINEVLCNTDMGTNYNDIDCALLCNQSTCLEVIYLEMLRKQIDNSKKCLNNNTPIYLNAKNFSFVQKLKNFFGSSDITELKLHEAK